MAEMIHTCEARISTGTNMFHRSVNRRKHGVRASILRNGKWYCKTHDPELKAERERERELLLDKRSFSLSQQWDDMVVGAHIRKTNPKRYSEILNAIKAK